MVVVTILIYIAADRLCQILLGEGGHRAAGEFFSLGTGHPQGKSTHVGNIRDKGEYPTARFHTFPRVTADDCVMVK